jgi:hypothetical protein
MSLTKHKIFKIKISSDGNFNLDETTQNAINVFLSESNNVYVNHATCVLTEDVDKYGSMQTINKFLVVSLVYKDLEGTPMSLTKVSKKTKAVVQKEVESGTQIIEPLIMTNFEKEISQLEGVASNSEKTGAHIETKSNSKKSN